MLDIKTTTVISCAAATASATPSKYSSLNARQAARPSRRTLQAAAKAHEFESVKLHDSKRMAPAAISRRSSCFELGSDKRRYHTIHFGKDSEELRQLAQANVAQLVQTASGSDTNNALLARKALQFRKINYTSRSC